MRERKAISASLQAYLSSLLRTTYSVYRLYQNFCAPCGVVFFLFLVTISAEAKRQRRSCFRVNRFFFQLDYSENCERILMIFFVWKGCLWTNNKVIGLRCDFVPFLTDKLLQLISRITQGRANVDKGSVHVSWLVLDRPGCVAVGVFCCWILTFRGPDDARTVMPTGALILSTRSPHTVMSTT